MKTMNRMAGGLGVRAKRAKLPAIGKGALLSLAVAMGPAAADDTEVFFGQVDPNTDINPNVLFVLDTSGSMNNWDDGYDGSRLSRLKKAMTTIIDKSTNLNIGLMRFNGLGGGGAVIYPVKGLDEEVCEGGACGEVSISRRVEDDFDDAAEKYWGHWSSWKGEVLWLSHEKNEATGERSQMVGVRFDDLPVPQGAKITSAKIIFTADETSDEDLDEGDNELEIWAEAIDDSEPFVEVEKDISERKLTDAKADWEPEQWTEDERYSTPDVSELVEEVVGRNNWCGGNALSFVFHGDAFRAAKSRKQGSNSAPLLRVTYDAASIPADGGCIEKSSNVQISSATDDAQERINYYNQMYTYLDYLYFPRVPGSTNDKMVTGLRFKGLGIPRNAEIISAEIELNAAFGRAGDSVVNVDVENTNYSKEFKDARRNITNRTLVNNPVAWTLKGGANSGQKFNSPNLKALVQTIVNRADWKPQNPMSFVISHKSGSGGQYYKTYEYESPNAPKLRILYRTTAATGTIGSKIKVRDQLKEVVNNLTATGGTPIVSAYHEAAQYMLGGGVDFGRTRGDDFYPNYGDQRSRFHRVSDPSSYEGGDVDRDGSCTDADPDSGNCLKEKIVGDAVYTSPLGDSCQSNHIVFLSDGAPTSNDAIERVKKTTGVDSCMVNTGLEACGIEMGEWLRDTDHVPGVKGLQGISTYTIGFNQNSKFLETIAKAGGGKYNQANSADQLVDTFQSILSEVAAVDTSFVAPGATVNQFNRLTHRSDIYFALFQPNQRPSWNGNLKRYEVRPTEPDADGEVTIQIQGQDGEDAIDVDTGFFADNSWSLWSESRDGSSVAAGGAAAELTKNYKHGSGKRRVFTYTGDNSAITGSTITADLSDADHLLHEDNNEIKYEDLGIENRSGDRSEYRKVLLSWARGIDVKDDDQDGKNTDIRNHIGDPMHSRPVILNYKSGAGSDTTIFVSTNEGFLHAIDRGADSGGVTTKGGTEIFSFIPKELLGNLNKYFENQAETKHPYGLDGALSVWTEDVNNNVLIDGNERAFIYVGMRRGGNNYYALDVTERTKPKLAWVIKGGPDGTPGFEELGQSWSRMVPSQIMLNGKKENVLIFGGGYDINQDLVKSDPNRVAPADGIGRAIYIVDAETGDLIYSVSGSELGGHDQFFPQMTHAIPGNIRVVDIDFDGLSDQLWVGDMSSQLWRFDIKKYHQASDGELMTGGVVAKLDDAGITNDRRFYSEPDVSVISKGGDRFLAVSVGSGWRAHPLNEVVQDRFYMIRTDNVYSAPENGLYGKISKSTGLPTDKPITEADLIDVTDDTDAKINDYGWKLRLEEPGEKVLGPSITVNNQVIFTSYRPAPDVEDCSTAIGEGAVYALDVLNGAPVLDLDESGGEDRTKNDRSKVLAHGGIPPDPAALITSSADGKIIKPTILVGPEQPLDLDFNNLTQRSFWMDREIKEKRGVQVTEGGGL